MTNQNCLACHQPMYVNKTYFICQTDGCELENHLIYKSDIEKRPPHPLEQKVEEFRNYLKNRITVFSAKPDDMYRQTVFMYVEKEFNKIFGEKE